MKKSIVKSLGVAALTLAVLYPSTDGQVANAKAAQDTKILPTIAESYNNHSKFKGVTYDDVIIPIKSKDEGVIKLADERSIQYYRVTVDYLNVRTYSHARSKIADVLVKNWTVKVTHINGHWGKLESGGYINLKYTKKLSTASGESRLDKQAKTSKPKPTFIKPENNNLDSDTYVVKKRVTNKSVEVGIATVQPRQSSVKADKPLPTVKVVQKKAPVKQTETVSTGKYNFSASELDLFARIVRAESGSESYTGQVAVASVILNRIDSGQFPNTLQGVIYQKNQFSPVTNGAINKPSTASTRKAVAQAISGEGRLYGALYFYAPKYVSSPFMDSRPTVTTIGGHVFKR